MATFNPQPEILDDIALEAWRAAPMRELLAHLMSRYHLETRVGLAELENLAARGALFQGGVFTEIRDEVALFAKEIRLHMEEEETTLFPAVLAFAEGGEVSVDHELVDPLELLEDEHMATFRLMVRIRGIVAGFGQSDDPLRRDLAQVVEALAASIRNHVQLESEALFRRLP